MSTIVVASGLPSSLSSAAATALRFGSVLEVPANLTNKVFNVRAKGVISLPAGSYSAYLSVNIARQADGVNLMGNGSAEVLVSGPSKFVPFNISAFVYCDPFAGSILDVNCPASRIAASGPFGQSGAMVGEDSPNNFAASAWGGGTASFADPTPLVVIANFYNGPSGPALPTLNATLNTFELEY